MFRIAIVDDEAAAVYRDRLLEAKELRPVIIDTYTGITGNLLAQLSIGTYDLAIIDMFMDNDPLAGMAAVSAALRAGLNRPHIVMVAQAASARDWDVLERLGVDERLSKPFSLSLLPPLALRVKNGRDKRLMINPFTEYNVKRGSAAPAKLSKSQLAVLAQLVAAKRRIVPAQRLGDGVAQHIHHIRDRLEHLYPERDMKDVLQFVSADRLIDDSDEFAQGGYRWMGTHE